jgi:hypothetical protein
LEDKKDTQSDTEQVAQRDNVSAKRHRSNTVVSSEDDNDNNGDDEAASSANEVSNANIIIMNRYYKQEYRSQVNNQ